MKMTNGWSGWHIVLACICVVASVMLVDGLVHEVLAQNPFGAKPAAQPKETGLIGWILQKQSEFYRQMSGTIRAAKSDGSAVWTLLGISFAYGVFHAAGPGHGKAVISSYVIANEETARRGIVLSFVSAMMQAVVAVLIVGIGTWLLNITAKTMCSTERWIEIVSYALIAMLGLRLVWTKGRGFLRALGNRRQAPAGLAVAHAGHGHAHDHHHHDAHDHHHPHDHAHGAACSAPGHVHDEHCGHSHGPTPDQLAGPGGWARGLTAIFAVGLRPCSGALLVLVFALAQGMLWAGVAATFLMGLGTAITVASIAVLAVTAKGFATKLTRASADGGALVIRGLELGAAGLVLLFGAGLLLGYLSAERVTCF